MATQLDSPKLRLFEDDARAIDKLFREALKAKGRPALAEMLTFLARFRRFSLFYGMLIRVQRPGALAVASRHKWTEMGRAIRSDAVPIIVLQPFGPVEFVYEFGDTTGDAQPDFDNWDPFRTTGAISPHVWARTRAEAARWVVSRVARPTAMMCFPAMRLATAPGASMPLKL